MFYQVPLFVFLYKLVYHVLYVLLVFGNNCLTIAKLIMCIEWSSTQTSIGSHFFLQFSKVALGYILNSVWYRQLRLRPLIAEKGADTVWFTLTAVHLYGIYVCYECLPVSLYPVFGGVLSERTFVYLQSQIIPRSSLKENSRSCHFSVSEVWGSSLDTFRSDIELLLKRSD